ncbi:nucleoporin Ndc1 isoform X1 [Anopheles stephensi]|uniref:nucleoporin Ndc1 isoform X1 n=1 Tax=Anopheles stephensi TaxID=30069 RepID=UPI001658951F|nr:nucleoporin Ndc1 isoform X1 [Anopheles stephensi]XP_035901873.1 nucleoporin Ndc1 isoform X1 [Anopheles stephensi]
MDPVGAKDLAFRKICTERFILSICYSLLQQYLLVTIFLLFINFSILHPINWIVGTVRLLVSFYPWIASVPLAVGVTVHGVVLAKSCLLESRYHSTNFLKLYRNLIQRSALLLTNGTIGCLTAWLYTRFLRDEYRLLFLSSDQDEVTYLNERFVYLLLSGVFAGSYYFAREQSNPGAVDFSIILLPKVAQYWNNLSSALTKSLRKSFVGMFIYMSFYYTISCLLRHRLASFLGGAKLQDDSTLYSFCNIVMDVRLLVYTCLFSALILSNINLMHVLFRIFLNEPQHFSLETSVFHANDEPLLADALAYKQIPIVQQLAADDLFVVAEAQSNVRRKQLFALTVPGGHPNNWRRVYEVCMKLIGDFTQELEHSIDGIGPKPAPPMVLMGGVLRPTASVDKELLMKKQYNQNFGIRSLSSPTLNSPPVGGNAEQLAKSRGKAVDGGVSLATALKRIPGYDYLFVESKSSKSYYLLSVQSQLIVKVTQSLVAIASRSLAEDTYGVLQNDLSCIVHTLLELKRVVDKIGSINLDVKRVDRNYIALKGAVKRSLYRFTNAFGPYIKHLVIEPEDLKALQGFVNFREV